MNKYHLIITLLYEYIIGIQTTLRDLLKYSKYMESYGFDNIGKSNIFIKLRYLGTNNIYEHFIGYIKEVALKNQ